MNKYRKARNNVTYTINKAKKDFYYKAIKSSRNSKNLWYHLKTLLPSKKVGNIGTSELCSNDFNKFFSSIGHNITCNFNGSTANYNVCNNPPAVFSFTSISNEFTYKSILNLKDSTCLDVLDLNTKLLKIAAHDIAPSLTHILNLSLKSGEVPDDFKSAIVTPVFKNKGSIKDVSSYRPISVISHISKILESGVKEQIFSHLINHKLLSSAQFAYVKGKSTQLALHTIIERYLKKY